MSVPQITLQRQGKRWLAYLLWDAPPRHTASAAGDTPEEAMAELIIKCSHWGKEPAEAMQKLLGNIQQT